MAVQADGPLARRATRRTFLKYGAASATSAALAGTAIGRWPAAADAAAQVTSDGFLELFVNEGYVEMVDRSVMYMRGFGAYPTARDAVAPSLTIPPVFFRAGAYRPVVLEDHAFPLAADGAYLPDYQEHAGRPGPFGRNLSDPDPVHLIHRRFWASYFPRRTIIAEEGARVKLRITNNAPGDHSFEVSDLCERQSCTRSGTELEFTAETIGTFIYHDPTNAPVERVLGLHGILIVVPRGRDGFWNVTADTEEFERQWVWICHDWDSDWARRAAMGAKIDPVATPPVPDYFTINDRSGFKSMGVTTNESINDQTHRETIAQGYARRTDVRDFSLDGTPETVVTGQALRLVNTGIATHQLHWHGNHVWTFRKNGRTFSRSTPVLHEDHVELQQWEDVVELDPFDRKDAMLPIKPPPDVLKEVLHAQHEDWQYPMHCHAEMSQTAGGGLYPGGMVADWILAPPKSS